MLSRILYRAQDCLFPAFANRYWRQKVSEQVRSLVYHRVGRIGEFPFIDAFGAPVIDALSLARDIRFLQNQGARFLTFADLREGRFPGAGEFGVIVSFDDGTRDVYERGLPLLESLGVRGVVFQVSSFIGARKLIWEHQLYLLWSNSDYRSKLRSAMLRLVDGNALPTGDFAALNMLREWPDVSALKQVMCEVLMGEPGVDQGILAEALYPSAAHVRDAAKAGHEIGSHGQNHLMRTALDQASFELELACSKAELETITGSPVLAFSHPFNRYEVDDRLCLERNFDQVATVGGGAIVRDSDAMALSRINWPGEFRNDFRWRRWLWTGG